MRKAAVVLIPLVFAALTARASAEIVQFFGPGGEVIARPEKRDSGSRGAPYQLPEGVKLLADVSYVFYPVFGRTFAETVRSSEENGPFHPALKRRAPSRSVWNVGWSYGLSYSHDIDRQNNAVYVSVEMKDLKVFHDVTVYLPVLIDDTSMNPVEKTLWKNYFTRLMDHEHDHARIVRDEGVEKEAITKLSELDYFMLSYEEGMQVERLVEPYIREESEKIGRAWARAIAGRCEEYDKITDFGKKHAAREAFFRDKPAPAAPSSLTAEGSPPVEESSDREAQGIHIGTEPLPDLP